MIKSIKVLSFMLALPLAGVAFALDGAKLAATEQPTQARRHATAETVRNSADMQALCHEVLVDTDEGYGVTNREPRFVCDESRR